MLSADQEIENLRAAVAHHFNVYGVVVTPLALTFQVAVPADGNVEKPFDGLRQELMPRDYIPTITRERGELLIHIQRRPKQKFAGLSVNLVMLVATVLTTVFWGGAYNWSQYVGEPLLSPDALLNGTLFFTVPLLAILGFHEMGHYVVARHYKMQASLPFFLPSIPPLGTFGAFISMRDPLPSRRALLDVGASGPLVGFAIAIPVTIAGLFLTAASPRALLPVGNEFLFVQPSLFYAFLKLFFPIPDGVAIHPLAFAGWVGLFVTAINLLPAGQLDGGHIARALLGERQGLVSWGALLLLVGLSVFYTGWLIFAFLILIIGVRHPPPLNDLSHLDAGRKLIGIAAVAILLTTFVIAPFQFTTVQQGVAFQDLGGRAIAELNTTVARGATATLAFLLNDTSSVADQVQLTLAENNLNNFNFTLLYRSVEIGHQNRTVNASSTTFSLAGGQDALVVLQVTVPLTATAGSTVTFSVQASVNGETPPLALPVHVTIA